SENTAPVSSGGTPCGSTWHQNQSLEPKDKNPSCPVAPQPDESGDEKFLSRHPEAAVFSAKKKIWGSAEDLKCAEWIRSRIVKLYEQASESDGEIARPKEPNWADWANEIRLMCSQDGRTHKQICELFAKANRDPFWCKNILSPSKLREKWDDLTLKLSVNPASPAGGHWNTAEAWENTL
ncbi:helix-turn-helix domain-containing protein, partial [Serratia bockelmannii]